MPSTFDRATSSAKRTLAASRYRADSRQINQFHWVGRLAAGGLDKAISKHEDVDDPMKVMQLPSTYYGRIGPSMAVLREGSKESQRWRRLLTLVMLSSALERYILSAATLAVASDPLLVPGFPKLVDGLSLARRGAAPPPRDLGGLITGDWNQRLAAYKSLFGSLPPDVQKYGGDLERLRKSRNHVAHALGVDDERQSLEIESDNGFTRLLFEVRKPALTPRVSVSEERILKLMRITQLVVDAIDQHLLQDFIGAYEILATWESWNAAPSAFEEAAGIILSGTKKGHGDRFRNVVGGLFGTTPGTHYVQGVVEYASRL